MSLNFDLPLRIHWRPGTEAEQRVVRAIRAASPLSVLIHVSDVQDLAATGLPWEGCSLVVIHHGWQQKEVVPEEFEARRWEFPVNDIHEVRTLVENGFAGVGGEKATLRWFPRRGQLGDLVPILELALKCGCSVTLPNRPADVITSEGRDGYPDPAEATAKFIGMARALAGALGPGRLRIHDFILAEALGGESAEPIGCEAGNAIAFIDQEGTVYPCETLLVPLGSLAGDSLEDIWASPVRQRVRSDVSRIPGVCAGCAHLRLCRGGCRGAVYHLQGHYGGVDPMCRKG